MFGSEAGGRTAATLYSVVGTCKHLGIDPFAYLKDALPGLFALGETPAVGQLLDWLPDRWRLRTGASTSRPPPPPDHSLTSHTHAALENPGPNPITHPTVART